MSVVFFLRIRFGCSTLIDQLLSSRYAAVCFVCIQTFDRYYYLCYLFFDVVHIILFFYVCLFLLLRMVADIYTVISNCHGKSISAILGTSIL